MSGIRTDLLALACILGGAGVGGGLTMAYLNGQYGAPMDCAVETMALGPQIVVSSNQGSRAVVMSVPHLEVHSARGCGAVVVGGAPVHLMELRQEMEEARVRMQVSRRHLGEARHMVVRIREAEAQAAEAAAQGAEAEAQLEAARILLEKVGKRGGGQMD